MEATLKLQHMIKLLFSIFMWNPENKDPVNKWQPF